MGNEMHKNQDHNCTPKVFSLLNLKYIYIYMKNNLVNKSFVKNRLWGLHRWLKPRLTKKMTTALNALLKRESKNYKLFSRRCVACSTTSRLRVLSSTEAPWDVAVSNGDSPIASSCRDKYCLRA